MAIEVVLPRLNSYIICPYFVTISHNVGGAKTVA